MDALKGFKNLHYALVLLAERDLYIFDSVDEFKKPVGLFHKGLKLDLDPDHFDQKHPFNIRSLRTLAETCLTTRNKLDELRAPNDSPIVDTLNSCINYVERIYRNCYGLRDFHIEKMQYDEKVYDLLIALGIYKSDSQYFGGFDLIDWNDKEQKEEAKKLDLIDFAKNNLEDVIRTIHSWARENSQYNARIGQGMQEVILVHDLIQAAKKTRLALE